ncbi:putative virion structural protein [Pseudomonas phage OBP]|uniref:putative virion structural protein n=1 Tax=Pseudomonas phage OBP TaxID=1124849 RepID=UPI000240D439|nr:putative virion structural protein [Pseudomonas phage OBP]AEV89528.1 putative virion structural protein [Pseudomonas phage OBP]
MSDMIDLTNVDLGAENLGDMWLDFIARVHPAQATLFIESYNLITLSFPDSYIDSTLEHLFIDEGLDTADLIAHVRKLFIDTFIDALQIMGIIIDKDFLTMDHLEPLKIVIDTIYLFDGMTDLIGLVDVLDDDEADCKERFLKIVRLTQPQYENKLDDMEYFIEDVSMNTIRGIKIGLNLIDEDDDQVLDHVLKQRIIRNKQFLVKTFAGTHIANGGGVGLNIDVYFTLFANELALSLVDEEPIVYLGMVLSLMIISDLSDKEIFGQFTALIEDHCSTIEEVYKGNEILKEVKLDA